MDLGLAFMVIAFAWALWIGIGLGTVKQKLPSFIGLSLLTFLVVGFAIMANYA